MHEGWKAERLRGPEAARVFLSTALRKKPIPSLNRRMKGWKAERKTDARPLALSAFQPSSLSAFFVNCGARS